MKNYNWVNKLYGERRSLFIDLACLRQVGCDVGYLVAMY